MNKQPISTLGRFYKINYLVDEFRGAQSLDAVTLKSLSDVDMRLNKPDPLKNDWNPVNFHSIGPISPDPTLFSIYSSATLAYRSDIKLPPPFAEKMAGICEYLDAFLEGKPITIIHFLHTVDVLDFKLSEGMTFGGGVRTIYYPVFLPEAKVNSWCFLVKSMSGSSLFTQGAGPGTFIDFYLKNKMTGLEFVPQRFSSDDPESRIG